MKVILIMSVFIFAYLFSVKGQSYEIEIPKSYGLVFGYQGYKMNCIELGIVKGLGSSLIVPSKKKLKRIKKYPYNGLYGSIHYDPSDNIKGLILGFSGRGGLAYGLDFNYYSYDNDFWGLRLSYGISIFGFETIYRYNFRLSGEKTPGISGHLFSVRYYLPLFVMTDNGYKFCKRYRMD